MDAEQNFFDHRAFRFGTVLGGLALLAALGAFKNFMALFSGEREGYVLFGKNRLKVGGAHPTKNEEDHDNHTTWTWFGPLCTREHWLPEESRTGTGSRTAWLSFLHPVLFPIGAPKNAPVELPRTMQELAEA